MIFKSKLFLKHNLLVEQLPKQINTHTCTYMHTTQKKKKTAVIVTDPFI